MHYTPFLLFGLGLLGIIAHTLVKLDSLNRQSNGTINLRQFFALERFSILISICVITGATIGSQEIAQLQVAGKWLGLGFIAIGYMAQSILIKLMGRASKYVDDTK